MSGSSVSISIRPRLSGTLRPTAIRLRNWVVVAVLRQPRPRPADGPGSVTLVSRTGAQRGFVAPLDAAPVCRSATDSTLFLPQKLAATELLFCFAGNHGPFAWSPAFRRSGPAKAGTTCNFPRRPCFVMESVRGLDIAKKPCSGSSSLRMESRLGVCSRDGFSGSAPEERPCFGVRAAERSVDAALAVPEEANPLTPNQHLNPLHCKP